MKAPPRKLLVTGAAGYVGSALVARAGGWEVTAAYLEREPEQGAPLRLDVRDADAVDRAFADVRPDAVVHTAYRLAGETMWETNVDGAANVARAAARAGARLVHMSTDLVFDGDLAPPARYAEDDATRPRYPYGRAKVEAERLVAAADPDAVLVRTSLVYGGAAPSPYEERALAAARGDLEMGFYTNELRCPILAGDLAAAILELLERPEVRGPLHVAGGDVVSRYEFSCLVAAHHGLDPSLLDAAESTDPARPRNCALDCSRAAALLATELRGVRLALPPR